MSDDIRMEFSKNEKTLSPKFIELCKERSYLDGKYFDLCIEESTTTRVAARCKLCTKSNLIHGPYDASSNFVTHLTVNI